VEEFDTPPTSTKDISKEDLLNLVRETEEVKMDTMLKVQQVAQAQGWSPMQF